MGFISRKFFPWNKVLLINQSTNVFVFADFKIHHQDWLTCSGRTDRHGKLYYNFSNSKRPYSMVNFSTCIPDCDFHSLALFDIFLSSDPSICFAMAFPPLRNSDHVVVSFPLTFCQTEKEMPVSLYSL